MELASSGGGYGDQVPRLEEFRAGHPQVEIASPLVTKSAYWRARAADSHLLTVQLDLGRFLDVLEAMAERGEL